MKSVIFNGKKPSITTAADDAPIDKWCWRIFRPLNFMQFFPRNLCVHNKKKKENNNIHPHPTSSRYLKNNQKKKKIEYKCITFDVESNRLHINFQIPKKKKWNGFHSKCENIKKKKQSMDRCDGCFSAYL